MQATPNSSGMAVCQGSPGDLPHLVRILCSELYSDDIVATVASITINVCRSQIERRDNAAVGPQ